MYIFYITYEIICIFILYMRKIVSVLNTSVWL